ncbi:hypothetical protein [Saccharopolyspora sp. ASAGF58]|uniref:hypothetical protein n=1 Tax=Saccharopolyspora sp. ASAGF58 TaxID=2719023 RepID=UPI00143FE1DB|nr:hypothetical protein [Saccharopolyspora sp. ASAGF58]QIZ35516.1 hypothetical protein FDZ84_13430 [Saccharopolyspora sp. ASAGF58]
MRADPRGLLPWVLENPAVAVIAYAQHGRLDLAEELPHALTAMLAAPLAKTSPHLEDFPICGALLLALAWRTSTGPTAPSMRGRPSRRGA